MIHNHTHHDTPHHTYHHHTHHHDTPHHDTPHHDTHHHTITPPHHHTHHHTHLALVGHLPGVVAQLAVGLHGDALPLAVAAGLGHLLLQRLLPDEAGRDAVDALLHPMWPDVGGHVVGQQQQVLAGKGQQVAAGRCPALPAMRHRHRQLRRRCRNALQQPAHNARRWANGSTTTTAGHRSGFPCDRGSEEVGGRVG